MFNVIYKTFNFEYCISGILIGWLNLGYELISGMTWLYSTIALVRTVHELPFLTQRFLESQATIAI